MQPTSKRIRSKLLKLYPSVKSNKRILDGVKKGEEDFLNWLGNGFSHDTSQVHDYGDVQVQAFILAIPSKDDLERIVTKTFLCYASHFIDDHFDRPDLDPYPEKLAKHRHDIKGLFDSMGKIGELGHLMAQRTNHPEAVYKGHQRMVYGGLVQLARNKEEQDMYLSEYKQLGLKDVSDDVRQDITKIRDVAYWITNKFCGEFFFAAEVMYNSTLVELWNLIIRPAGYLHDNIEEREKGELNFFGKPEPSVDEMVEMIDIAVKHINNYEDERASQRLQQIQFLRRAFEPVLPKEVQDAYARLEKQLEEYIGRN